MSTTKRRQRARATSPEAREMRTLFELNERELAPRSAFRRELEQNLAKGSAKGRNQRRGGSAARPSRSRPVSPRKGR